jgi:hypothetical protein
MGAPLGVSRQQFSAARYSVAAASALERSFGEVHFRTFYTARSHVIFSPTSPL